MPNPVASVILPVYNSQSFIEKTLLSLVNQSFKDFEVIIVDDGSTDETLSIANNFKNKLNITLFKSGHTADVGKNRNIGLDNSKGEFIYFIDSDDIWEPEKMEYFQSLFQKGNGFICSNAKVIDENDNIIKEKFFKNPDFDFNIKLSDLVKLNFVITSSLAIRKDVIGSHRFYEEPGFIVEDYMFWLKLIESNPGLFIDKSFVRYRIHKSNFSLGTREKRIKVLTRGISILQEYFSYIDPEVSKKAKEGCTPLYKELVQIYFKNKNYVEAYNNIKKISFKPGNLNFRSFIFYGFLFILLYFINFWQRSCN